MNQNTNQNTNPAPAPAPAPILALPNNEALYEEGFGPDGLDGIY